ncbi:unnamed protein product [Rotaria sordida]|uniref:Uncharacterized protein n=1 Tax=Rotaria sordida TaxID=392033 RepID=A0A815JZP0_9BILA|nr:unnamed protein product [Rotaria sordida]
MYCYPLYDTLVTSQQHLTVSEKASKICGADVSSTTSTNVNPDQQLSSGNRHNALSASSATHSALMKNNVAAAALQN